MEHFQSITKEEKQINLKLLDKLMDNCYIDKLTGQFFCKKCKCVVSIDWKNHMAYCVAAGNLCICINKEDIIKQQKKEKLNFFKDNFGDIMAENDRLTTLITTTFNGKYNMV